MSASAAQEAARIAGLLVILALAALVGQIFDPELSSLAVLASRLVVDYPFSSSAVFLAALAGAVYAGVRAASRYVRTRLG